METTITTCGWVLFGLLTAALTIFAVAFLYGCGFLGYRLSSRLIRERKWWKKAVRQGDHRITHYAAVTMSDRLGYGEAATLGGTSETQTKITQTDMTTEEKAKAYAENIFGNPITPRGIEETRVARNAYLAGATEALSSQWKDPKVESFIVKGESFDYILSEPLGRPLAELSALSGFDSVSHRDNDIKTVIYHRLVRICNLQKMQIAFLRKLSIMKYVADMSGYNTYIPLKQFAHLALCKPDGLIGKEDIYLYNAVLGLVYYNFVIHNHIKTSATVSCRDKVTLRDITSVAELNIFRESVTNHLIQS